MSQITTNNYTDMALEDSSAQSQTSNITKGEIMENQTTLEAEIVSTTANITITTEDLQMNAITENTQVDPIEIITTTVIDNEAVETETTEVKAVSETINNEVTKLTKSNNPWIKSMQAPTASEIEAIKEARRVELISENNALTNYGVVAIEKCVTKLLDDKQLLSQGIVLTLENGEQFEVEELVIRGTRHKVLDMIQPQAGTGRLTHVHYFDAKYTTGLRMNETYPVVYTLSSIKTIIGNLYGKTIAKKSVLRVLIKALTLTKVSTHDIYDIEKRLEESFIIDKGNTFVADALKAIREAKKVAPAVQESENEKRAFEIMKDYAVLNNQGQFRIINTTKLGLVTSSVSELRNLFANQKIDGQHAVDIWMESDKRPLFTDTKFDPSYSSHDDKYNLFKGFKYQAKPLVDISFFKDFTKEVICSDDELLFNIVWTFLAQMVQKPSQKMGTALVLLSAKGAGKSFFVGAIGKMMEGYFMQTAESKRLLGEFNNHLASTLLFYANELTFTDNKKVVAKLKNLITETEFTYELKGGATFSGKNYNRLIIDSNDDLAVVQTADERRFIYPVISEVKIGDTEYFNKLAALCAQEGFYESLMHDLMNFDYSAWEHYLKTPPKNEVTEAQVLSNFSNIDSWWLNCLEEGKLPMTDYTVAYDGTLSISSENLYQSFKKFTLKNGGRLNGMDSGEFIKTFKKHILKELDLDIVHRPTINGRRTRLNIYAKLSEQVEHFKAIKRLNTLDWSGEDWEATA